MDPDANLGEQLRLAAELTERYEIGGVMDVDATRLAELVCALDAWIAGGGFLPARWNKNK